MGIAAESRTRAVLKENLRMNRIRSTTQSTYRARIVSRSTAQVCYGEDAGLSQMHHRAIGSLELDQ